MTLAATFIHAKDLTSPETVKNAILKVVEPSNRKLAVLGDMIGWGADELSQHAALAGPLESVGFARVFTVGECMRALRGALPRAMRAAHADSPVLIEQPLRAELADGDLLLVLGSDEGELGALVARLKGEGAHHVV